MILLTRDEVWEIGRGQIRTVDVQPHQDLDITTFGQSWQTFLRSNLVTIRFELEVDRERP